MRRTDREITDSATLRDILKKAHVINTAINDSPAPYVVPTNYGFEFVNGKLRLYVHGAPEGRKRTLIAANPDVSFSIYTNTGLYTPGPEESVGHYSYFFQSILGSGKASLIDDLMEKEHAMRLILEHEAGHPIDDDIPEHDLAYVGVIRIDVDGFTGKQHLNK